MKKIKKFVVFFTALSGILVISFGLIVAQDQTQQDKEMKYWTVRIPPRPKLFSPQLL